MKFNKDSKGYREYIHKIKMKKIQILSIQIFILVSFIALWEISANLNIIDTFLFSKPSQIFNLFLQYSSNGELFRHISVSVYETLVGLVITSILSISFKGKVTLYLNIRSKPNAETIASNKNPALSLTK